MTSDIDTLCPSKEKPHLSTFKLHNTVTMNKITDVIIKPLNSTVCKPFTMHYTQNGVKKSWDLLIVEDSVVVIVYNISRKVLLFQKLFKPAVYYGNVPEEERNERIDTEKYPPDLGITYQFCSQAVKSGDDLVNAARKTVENAFGMYAKRLLNKQRTLLLFISCDNKPNIIWQLFLKLTLLFVCFQGTVCLLLI